MAKCMDVILARRTIRRFKPEPIARKDLMELVNAGRLASSAGNGQPWEFIVVDDRALVARLAQAAKSTPVKGAEMHALEIEAIYREVLSEADDQ